MELAEKDKAAILKMSEKQAKMELYSALTMIRKTVDDVPDDKKKLSTSYTKEGHSRCVLYLRGFLNIWEKNHGN